MIDDTVTAAVRVARMYFYQELTTQEIADELELSRSKVSRLLKLARERGLVEIRVRDPDEAPRGLERALTDSYGLRDVQVVLVPESVEPRARLDRVASVAATYLHDLMRDDTVLAVAWGTTVGAIARQLTPKPLAGVQVVQLNGSGNTHDLGVAYASEMLRRFERAYGARSHPFPMPTIFDYPDTKRALWRERSIRRVLDLHRRAGIALFSIGAVEAGVPSHVYTGSYLDEDDLEKLETERVVGDIATVFFREDGSWRDIDLNSRTSGPDLDRLAEIPIRLCVVSGPAKADGLRAALRGGYLTDVIVDEPTARAVVASAEA